MQDRTWRAGVGEEKKKSRSELWEKYGPPLLLTGLILALVAVEMPGLLRRWEDERLDRRLQEIGELENAGDAEAVARLTRLLRDRDPGVRGVAGRALAAIKNPRALEAFIAALKDNDPSVRAIAASALGWIKDARAVEPLIGALKDNDADVRFHAALALRDMTGMDFGLDQEQWQKWWEENKGRFADKPPAAKNGAGEQGNR
jgi:HEAT repeat protein